MNETEGSVSKAPGDPGAKVRQVIVAAARMPGVRIDRRTYLRTALKRYCTEDLIEEALASSPAVAGVPRDVITKAADTAVRYETSKVTALSTAAGIPGGLTLFGSVPADLVQYFSHVLRVAQKLAYLYSWPDLFGDEEELDEATEFVLVLFVGVMFGLQSAQSGVSIVASKVAEQVVKKLPQKALTKGTVYPVVKKVAGMLGVRMTKQVFAGGVAKAVPLVGAVLSGGLTLGTFLPMSRRLQKHLASLPVARPAPDTVQETV